MQIDVSRVGVTIDQVPIVEDVCLAVQPGEFTGIIGPNGSGKSTLLRTIYRALRPVTGTVRMGDEDVWRSSARASARRTAVVAQETPSDFDFSVTEVVLMGRTPHKGMLEGDTPEDWDIVASALERVGLIDKATRVYASLSGGEKQRVLLARALAQQSEVMILDEPTNHLDIRAQLDLLELVRELGLTTIAALHDLNLAAAYCDRLFVMSAGRLIATGETADVLTPDLLATVFGVRAIPGVHPMTGRLHLTFGPIAE